MAAFSNKPWNTITEVVAEGDKTQFTWTVGRVKTCRLSPTIISFGCHVFGFRAVASARRIHLFKNFDANTKLFTFPSFGDSISSKPIAAGQSSWKVVYFPKGFTVRMESQ
jgi:hypothetical protein